MNISLACAKPKCNKPVSSMKRRQQSIFDLEDGGGMFLREVGTLHRTACHYIPEDTHIHRFRCENHTYRTQTIITSDTPKT
jgi:hypothetical protein